MKKEYITLNTEEHSATVAGGKVTAFRANEKLKSTVRVYKDGTVGIAGQLGACDESELTNRAGANLMQGIPYPENTAVPHVISHDTLKSIIAEKDFVKTVAKLMRRITEENPDFLFSNKINLLNIHKTYEHSDGAQLSYRGNKLNAALLIKHRDSPAIFDEIYEAESDYFDEEQICADIKKKCDCFNTRLPQIEEEFIAVAGGLEVIQYILQHFVADMYCTGASLLKDKLNTTVFNKALTLCIDRSPKDNLATPFFDAEGVVNPEYKACLIKQGIFCGLLTTKKSADKYKIKNIGSAYADYTSVPMVGYDGLTAQTTHKDIGALVGKQRTVYVSVSSGGDITPDGILSLPVQAAYLYENGQLTGRLPELTLTANIFDILGKDFLGVTDKGIFTFGRQKILACRMKAVNKSSFK